MAKEKYILIQEFMVRDLGLKGNELLVYAIVYGFSQDNESKFIGSLNYIADFINVNKTTVMRTLQELIKKGFINKYEYSKNGVKFCEYSAVMQNEYSSSELHIPVAKCNSEGGGKMQPNNTNNILINKLNNTSYKEIDKESMFELFWKSYPRGDNKKYAKQCFMKISNLEKEFENIMTGLENFKNSKQWKDKQFIPHASTWLNRERWKDDLTKSENDREQAMNDIGLGGFV